MDEFEIGAYIGCLYGLNMALILLVIGKDIALTTFVTAILGMNGGLLIYLSLRCLLRICLIWKRRVRK